MGDQLTLDRLVADSNKLNCIDSTSRHARLWDGPPRTARRLATSDALPLSSPQVDFGEGIGVPLLHADDGRVVLRRRHAHTDAAAARPRLPRPVLRRLGRRPLCLCRIRRRLAATLATAATAATLATAAAVGPSALSASAPTALDPAVAASPLSTAGVVAFAQLASAAALAAAALAAAGATAALIAAALTTATAVAPLSVAARRASLRASIALASAAAFVSAAALAAVAAGACTASGTQEPAPEPLP